MKRLLVIADDFTGALDTGVQFAKEGIPAKVTDDRNSDLAELFSQAQVVVVDTESRHLSPEAARREVAQVIQRVSAAKVDIIYKKTDSALRGNVGAELSALLERYPDETLAFAPAFPSMNRLTRDGVQYIDGVPVSESPFGQDPVDPVRASYIPEILRSTAPELPCCRAAEHPQGNHPGVEIYDAADQQDLRRITEALFRNKTPKLLAGCAGLASCLGPFLEALPQKKPLLPQVKQLVVLCGSVNRITREQVEYAQQKGFLRIDLLPCQFLQPDFFRTPAGERLLDTIAHACRGKAPVMICTMDPKEDGAGLRLAEKLGISTAGRVQLIRDCLGEAAAFLRKQQPELAFAITGGDTLVGVMRALGGKELEPLLEVGTGTVLAKLHRQDGSVATIVTKSGGFGEREIFVSLVSQLVL